MIRVPGGHGLALNVVLNIIQNNSMITKLIMVTYGYVQTVKISKIQHLIDEHPSLVELDLIDYKITGDIAFTLIHQLTLQKFRFRIENPMQYANFVSQVEMNDDNNQWKCSVQAGSWNPNVVTLVRKR